MGNQPKKHYLLKPSHSLSDQIYEKLKEKIFHGEIEPGKRLMQNIVANELGVSRTPVREAFRLLEQDGLVERIPQGGIQVSCLDQDTIEEVFGIRSVLETYAIELACTRITAEEIYFLKELTKQARKLLSAPSMRIESKIDHLFALNSQFHDTIYRASGNSYLLGMINSLRTMVVRLRFLGLRSHSTWSRAWREHNKLIKLLEKKNKKAAVLLIKGHLTHALGDVLFGMKAWGENNKSGAIKDAGKIFKEKIFKERR